MNEGIPHGYAENTVSGEQDYRLWRENNRGVQADGIYPGPTFNCRMPVFVFGEEVKSGDDLKKPMMELEFGRELAYFEAREVKANEGPVLQGKSTRAYTTNVGDSQLFLFTVGAPERPWAIVRQRGDAREMYWYTTYERLPFDSELFAKPRDVKIEETKQ